MFITSSSFIYLKDLKNVDGKITEPEPMYQNTDSRSSYGNLEVLSKGREKVKFGKIEYEHGNCTCRIVQPEEKHNESQLLAVYIGENLFCLSKFYKLMI